MVFKALELSHRPGYERLIVREVGATLPNSAAYPGLYGFALGPFSFGVGYNDDRGTASNSYQWGDGWSMAVGRHNLHVGGDLIRYQLNRYNNAGVRGGSDLVQLPALIQQFGLIS